MKVRVYFENNKRYQECETGVKLIDLIEHSETTYPVLAAFVDNELKDLNYEVYMPHRIRFIDITHPDGRRTYVRSLSFLLQRCVNELYPKYHLFLNYSLPLGLYGELRDSERGDDNLRKVVKLDPDEIKSIKKKMSELVAADLRFTKAKVSSEDAVRMFTKNRREEKANLIKSTGNFFVNVCFLDGYADTFYGPLLYSTKYLEHFDLVPYDEGFCLQSPSTTEPECIPPISFHDKLSEVLRENSRWLRILGARGIGSVNQAISSGQSTMLIQVAESLHERKYADIADRILARKERTKLVLIAGPSSSGKTTTSKRVALQLKVLGLNPVILELDNYFVSRDNTPKDENGEYDFEALNALDLPFLNKQINELLAGEEVEIPKFDFVTGERFFNGNKIKLHEKDILVMEGIHALNPELTKEIDDNLKYKIYASALTSLSIDENNNISTSDNRLLRRMVRDNSTRGINPESTIMRWPSVRRGEEKNIFPYQENADVMFNSSLIFEFALLKYYVEPLLRRIPPVSPAYSEALRLLNFLSYVVALTPDEIEKIPPTSVMREFVGGSSFS